MFWRRFRSLWFGRVCRLKDWIKNLILNRFTIKRFDLVAVFITVRVITYIFALIFLLLFQFFHGASSTRLCDPIKIFSYSYSSPPSIAINYFNIRFILILNWIEIFCFVFEIITFTGLVKFFFIRLRILNCLTFQHRLFIRYKLLILISSWLFRFILKDILLIIRFYIFFELKLVIISLLILVVILFLEVVVVLHIWYSGLSVLVNLLNLVETISASLFPILTCRRQSSSIVALYEIILKLASTSEIELINSLIVL